MLGRTWDNVETLDDIQMDAEKEIVASVLRSAKCRCPFLKQEGESWMYCGARVPEGAEAEASPTNPVYLARVGCSVLQLYCVDVSENSERYKKCINYSDEVQPGNSE